jgi:hypothetical protein
MNFFLHQANPPMAWWGGMPGAAVAILNCLARLHSRDKLLRRKSPYEPVYKRKPDLPQWPGPSGVGVFVPHRGTQGKPRTCEVAAGHPYPSGGGLGVQRVRAARAVPCSGALGVTSHMSVLEDIDTRLALLVKSGTFCLGKRLYSTARARRPRDRSGACSATPIDPWTSSSPCTTPNSNSN